MTGYSILISPLADTVTLADGTVLAIRTDFRVGLLVSVILSDPTLCPASKRRLALRLYYERLPEGADPDALFDAAMSFYRRNRGDGANPAGRATVREPILDFIVDGDRIYGAFYAAYGIDLCAARLHWWQFMALLVSLPRDSAFMRAVALRCVDPGEIADDAARKRLRMAKARVRIRRRTDRGEGTE